MEKWQLIPNRLIVFFFCLLFFLTPLIMTPFNFELFEFNKMLLVYLLTVIIAGSWLIKMLIQGRIIFRRSFWDIPLLLFLAGQVLSFAFSIDKHTSFWGYYSRFNGGLLSIISYLLLYWTFVSNMTAENTKKVIRWLLTSALIVSAYGIAEHFGIDDQLWVQDVKNRVFSTLGQPNWLAAFLVALIPLTWNKNQPWFFVIFYLCLLFTKSRSGFLGFGAAYLVYSGLGFWQTRKINRSFVFNSLIIVFLSLLIGTPFTSSLRPHQSSPPPTTPAVEQPLLISESGDIRKVVWKGALEIFKHHPLLGTGPETFAYSYYWYRPREHNDLSEWDFLYNKAHNEYLNLAATTGIIGLSSYLLLIITFIRNSLKIKNWQLKISLLAGFISILVTNFFGFSVVVVSLLFFLFPALTITLNSQNLKSLNTPRPKLWQYFLIPICLFVICYLLIGVGRLWYADALYAKGLKANEAGQADLAFVELQKAVKLRLNEPVFNDELALSAANLSVLGYKQDNATLAAQLTEMAISYSDRALKISPYHLNFWKDRTKVFFKLAEINPEYYQNALEALVASAKLAPTDPKILYNIAILYASDQQMEEAIKIMEQVLTLKPNYDEAQKALAIFKAKLEKSNNLR